MRLTRTHGFIGAAVIATAAAVGVVLRPDRVDVDTAVVTRTSLAVTVDADGTARVRDRYVITAPVAGRLHRIDLADGAHLNAGDVVARIAPLPLDAQAVRQAEARLTAARALAGEAAMRVAQTRAVLDQARRTARRTVVLEESGALSRRDREEAELQVQLREHELAAALAHERASKAEVDQARAALVSVGGGPSAIIEIRAPAAGCVLRIPERSERVVPAGAPIIEFGDPGALELVVDILSSDAARVREGQKVRLDEWGGDSTLAGRVRTLERAAFTRVSALGVEEQRVNVVIDILDPPPELSDGYRIDARIIVWDSADVVTVPVSALFRSGAAWAVFAVEGQRVRQRQVQIGEQGASAAQVHSGLAPGEVVVVFPSDQLADGGRVRVNR